MAVSIGVDLSEEVIELVVWDRKTRAAQSTAQFLFGKLAVAVVVDATEER